MGKRRREAPLESRDISKNWKKIFTKEKDFYGELIFEKILGNVFENSQFKFIRRLKIIILLPFFLHWLLKPT